MYTSKLLDTLKNIIHKNYINLKPQLHHKLDDPNFDKKELILASLVAPEDDPQMARIYIEVNTTQSKSWSELVWSDKPSKIIIFSGTHKEVLLYKMLFPTNYTCINGNYVETFTEYLDKDTGEWVDSLKQ